MPRLHSLLRKVWDSCYILFGQFFKYKHVYDSIEMVEWAVLSVQLFSGITRYLSTPFRNVTRKFRASVA